MPISLSGHEIANYKHTMHTQARPHLGSACPAGCGRLMRCRSISYTIMPPLGSSVQGLFGFQNNMSLTFSHLLVWFTKRLCSVSGLISICGVSPNPLPMAFFKKMVYETINLCARTSFCFQVLSYVL